MGIVWSPPLDYGSCSPTPVASRPGHHWASHASKHGDCQGVPPDCEQIARIIKTLRIFKLLRLLKTFRVLRLQRRPLLGCSAIPY